MRQKAEFKLKNQACPRLDSGQTPGTQKSRQQQEE